jgi:ubiquinone/menaquinone biosynthesis C-methylase UbiE
VKDEIRTLEQDVIRAYDDRASLWAEGKWDSRHDAVYMQRKLASDYRLLSRIDLRGKRVLNIGCSFPVDEIYWAHQVEQWVAIDLSLNSTSRGRQIVDWELSSELAQRVHFSVANACQLPFPSDYFDLSVAFSTLDHIPEHERRQEAICEMARTTKREGNVVITTPNRLHLVYYSRSQHKQRTQSNAYGFEHCFTPGELFSMCEEAGLRPIRFASNYSLADVDLTASPAIQRPFLKVGMVALKLIEKLGHRMGYLAIKE